MYPQCRFVRAAGNGCHAAAIKGSHWCYFHQRLLERQTAHQEAERRQLNRHTRRQRNGRFTAEPALLDPRPRQLPASAAASPDEAIALAGQSGHSGQSGHPGQSEGSETYDYGAYPVGDQRVPHPEQSEGWDAAIVSSAILSLPTVEDSASIQLALIDVLQALAANRLDTKRAGLLLYGLQVASANAKNVDLSCTTVRSVSTTSDGIPLGPQEYGWDVEDVEEAIAEEAEDED